VTDRGKMCKVELSVTAKNRGALKPNRPDEKPIQAID
jgi:hypothetical protein